MKKIIVSGLILLIVFAATSCAVIGNKNFYDDPKNHLYKIKSDFILTDLDGRGRSLIKDDRSDFVLISFMQSKHLTEADSIQKISGLKKFFADKKVASKIVVLDMKEDRDFLEKFKSDNPADPLILIDNTQVSGMDFGAVNSYDSFLIPQGKKTVIWRGSALENTAPGSGTQNETKLVESTKYKIEYSSIIFEDRVPDYANEIVPLVTKNCVSCHKEAGAAPWAMKNFNSLNRWKRMMREVVLTRRMPPAQSDSYYRSYHQDNAFSAEEIQKFVKWIDRSSSETPPLDPLANIKHEKTEDFVLGKPDYILEVPEQKIGADDKEFVTILKMNWPFDTPKRVRGMDVQTDNVRATHHLSIYYLIPGQNPEDKKPGVVSFDGGYIPGYRPTFLPFNTSYLVPPNSPIRVSPHVVPTGKDEKIKMRVGFYFDEDPEPNELLHCTADTRKIDIAPEEKNHRIRALSVTTEDLRVIQVGTHMHSRGRSIKYTAHLPNGKKEVLLSLPIYNRNWQREYLLKDPLFLPKGTKLECVGYYDNSKDNPLVSNSHLRIKYGWNADDEMMTCSCFAMRESDYQRKVFGKKIKYEPIPLNYDRMAVKSLE